MTVLTLAPKGVSDGRLLSVDSDPVIVGFGTSPYPTEVVGFVMVDPVTLLPPTSVPSSAITAVSARWVAQDDTDGSDRLDLPTLGQVRLLMDWPDHTSPQTEGFIDLAIPRDDIGYNAYTTDMGPTSLPTFTSLTTAAMLQSGLVAKLQIFQFTSPANPQVRVDQVLVDITFAGGSPWPLRQRRKGPRDLAQRQRQWQRVEP